MNNKNRNLLFLVLSAFVLMSIGFASAQPNGATPNVISSSSITPDSPGNDSAFAGNVTLMNIVGDSKTQTWQGYYGNVTGTIALADSSNNVLYNWSLANPSGEVFASMNDTIQWQNIQCFNYTANGTFEDDTGNAGGTSQFGLNITQLHEIFNIPNDASDSVNSTFNLTGGGGHPQFYVSSLSFSAGECQSTRLYVNSAYQTSVFNNVLLYEPNTTSVIFATVLESDETGFDGNEYDFQMLVLEDGRNGDVATTTYYFFVELE